MEKIIASCLLLLGLLFGFIGGVALCPKREQVVVPNFSFGCIPDPRMLSTESNWSFAVADYDRDGVPDLWVIKQANTGTHSTEIHILSGRDPHKFLLQTGTALHETPNNIQFKAEKE